MLGAFLLVVAHLLFEAHILGLIATPRMRAGNRPVFERSPGHPYQHFRRGAENMCILHAQKIEVRRGVHLAQSAIKVEWLHPRNEIEALGEHHLENVASGNVLLATFYIFQETLAAGSSVDLELGGWSVRRFTPEGGAQPRSQLLLDGSDIAKRAVIGRTRGFR